MGRPRNPHADPVRVTSDNRVQWYPSGFAGVGTRHAKRFHDRDEAEQFAEQKRAELRQVRAEAEREQSDPGPHRTIEDAYLCWLKDVRAKHPASTHRTYESRAHTWLAMIGGNRCGEMCLDLLLVPLRAAIEGRIDDDGTRRPPVSQATFDSVLTTVSSFVSWAIAEGWMHREARGVDEAREREIKKLRATQRRHASRQSVEARRDALATGRPADDRPDTDGARSIEETPTSHEISALCDAIERIESKPAPWHKQSGRGCRGGRKLLSAEEAWRISTAPQTAAATGLRPMELLALHADSVHENGDIDVWCQLDRNEKWISNARPPLLPQKYSKERRRTICWQWWLPTLLEVAEYAREHTSGWLYAPTANQQWWPRAFEATIARAKQLLDHEYEQAVRAGAPESERPPRFRYTPHAWRHHFATYSLAPVESGGFALDAHSVSTWLGHASSRTTLSTYRHEMVSASEHAREVTKRKPGSMDESTS